MSERNKDSQGFVCRAPPMEHKNDQKFGVLSGLHNGGIDTWQSDESVADGGRING